METKQEAYFKYLTKRSFVAHMYMRFYLYPRLARRMRGRALDVGCGVGGFLRYRKNTLGIDINKYNVEFCVKHGLDAKLIKSSHYPCEDEEFDSAILDNVLEHIDEPKVTLLELNRVLKVNGRLVIGVPGIRGFECDVDHKIFYDEKTLIEIMHHYGFSVDELMYVPVKSKFLSKKLRQYCLYGVFIKKREH